ncbi:uncharacterized protein LOC129599063 [Paramacrobiotus metropolitanus]|uniref:uncharacterized protein LOC129599063 n=1 Tax=Paramacrobiotus metropolitanus TaxID=2943436 RepID=UPI002445F735|nr:uncharacterized protein LOC129599063 [Paramacrobiotus metropolitanus]XP_055353174.1 uncharacterized protein LOC129599063 [Paramacrobiotus metropolitanus]
MLVYVGDVDAWNAVDVRIDGQLQHGRVINVVEGGLIIDFECPAQRSQFVEYGRIYYWSLCGANTVPDGTVVDVLLRRQPNDAWIWYPGTVVSIGDYDYDDAAWVEVQLPQGTVSELIPWQQVRPQPTAGRKSELRRLKKNAFVIRCCPLPATIYWTIEEAFQCVLVRSGVMCTSLLRQTLLYLQLREDDPLKPEHLEEAYHKAQKKKKRGCCTLTKLGLRILRRWPICATTEDWEVGNSDQIGLPLPGEMLVEVFQSLDSIGRVRCRRVCHVWNKLLTDTNFPDVRLTGSNGYYDGHLSFSIEGMFWLVSGILKCLQSRTQLVAITNVGLATVEDLVALLTTLHCATVVVFYDCCFTTPMYEIDGVIRRMASLAVNCGPYLRTVLKHCRIADYGLEGLIPQYRLQGPSRRDVEMQLWDLMESNLTINSQWKRHAALEWIAKCKRDDHIPRRMMYQILPG